MAKRRAKPEKFETTEAPLIPAELPEGWAVASLGDGLVVEVTPGFACGAHSRDTADVAHLRPMNVNADGHIDLGNVKYVPAPAAAKANKWLERGDVLFNNTNSAELVGKTAYYDRDERLAFSNHMTRVRIRSDGVDPRYCAFYLHANWRAGDFQARCNQHVSQASIGREALLDTPIPVPPLVEQKRIADRIEALLRSVDAGRERLAKLPNILRRLRQSILAAACSGRLTGDWREAHPDAEPSTNALARFDRDAPKHNGRDRRPAESTLDLELMPELPETWCYRRADSIVAPKTVITYGIVLPGPETPDGVPYVRQQDIQDGTILIDQLRRTTGSIAAKHDRSRLRKGDVLLCIIRHLRVAVVPPGLDGANLTQGTVRMRPSAIMTGEFLALFLASPHTQSWMKQRHFGMSMPRINVEHAREIPVAVPPATEQVEIVRRVRSLMNLAESIERRLAIAQVRTEKLTQAILARAYCGELVETEAELARAEWREYESGEALLARIRAKGAAPRVIPPAGRPRASPRPIVAATGSAPASGPTPKRGHSSTIFYKRAAVAAYIIDRLHTRPTFGRVQLEKCLYLAEAYVGVELEGDFKRAAAGPLDAEYLYKLESAAQKNGWFVKRTIAGDKTRHTYHPGAKSAQLLAAAEKYLGAGKAKMDFLLGWMEKLDTERAEIVATLFAAWSDLLRAGQPVTDDAIVTEVRENWHESKKRFEPDRLCIALGWMRKHALVPPAAYA